LGKRSASKAKLSRQTARDYLEKGNISTKLAWTLTECFILTELSNSQTLRCHIVRHYNNIVNAHPSLGIPRKKTAIVRKLAHMKKLKYLS
jgi:hypothetical protein